MRKSKLDNIPFENIKISKDCLKTITTIKPPFETTDDFVNRLMVTQMKYHQQKGREFINMVFQERFLSYSHEFLQDYSSNLKKKNDIEKIKKTIKKSIYDIFNETKDPIIPLLLLIDEGVTLLFQTDFYQNFLSFQDFGFLESIDEEKKNKIDEIVESESV